MAAEKTLITLTQSPQGQTHLKRNRASLEQELTDIQQVISHLDRTNNE